MSLTKKIRNNQKRSSWCNGSLLDVIVRPILTVLNFYKAQLNSAQCLLDTNPGGWYHIVYSSQLSINLLSLSTTVKFCLTTTSKIQLPDQDGRFRLALIFLVRDTSIKQCFKYEPLNSVTNTTHNIYWNIPKCYQRRLHHFCAACFGRLGFLPTMLEIFSINNLLKKTTCPRWPHYIGTTLFTTI